MAFTTIKRTKESYKEKVKGQSQNSVTGIFQAISNFENFSMEKYGKVDIIPDLIDATDEERFDVLQNWVNWNDSRSPYTVLVYFSRLRKYLHYMGIKLNDQDIKSELDFKRKIEEELYGLTLDDINTLFKAMQYKHRVQFMCQMSGLMRVGELNQIRKKHLITDHRNIIVKIPAHVTKSNKGRTTFFSQEASRLLRPILKDKEPDDLVFGSSDNPKNTAHVNLSNSNSNTEQILRNAIKKTGLDMRYESTGRRMITSHSFRAYGITKISRHDPNFAKKIAGQKGYLLQYDRMSDEEKLELYQKFESDLTIDETLRQKAEIAELKTEKEQWLAELKEKEDEYFRRLKAEILAEIADPNYKVTDPLESIMKSGEQDRRIRKDIGLD